MTIRFTARQVQQLLAILTPDIHTLDSVAAQIGEDSWELESMAHGKTLPTPKVLAYLDLAERRGRYEWRVE